MIPRLSLLLLAGFVLAGCTTAGRHVYIASDTTLGVIGAMNTAQTSGKLIIGYDRQFIAVVPKKSAVNDSGTAPVDAAVVKAAGEEQVAAAGVTARPGDVMSAYNCTHLQITGITVEKFYEHLATGPAAIALVAQIPAQGGGAECAYSNTSEVTE